MRIGEKVVEVLDGRRCTVYAFIGSLGCYEVEFSDGSFEHFGLGDLMTVADWNAAGSANAAEARSERRALGGE